MLGAATTATDIWNDPIVPAWLATLVNPAIPAIVAASNVLNFNPMPLNLGPSNPVTTATQAPTTLIDSMKSGTPYTPQVLQDPASITAANKALQESIAATNATITQAQTEQSNMSLWDSFSSLFDPSATYNPNMSNNLNPFSGSPLLTNDDGTTNWLLIGGIAGAALLLVIAIK